MEGVVVDQQGGHLAGCLPLSRWADLLLHSGDSACRALGAVYPDDPSLLRDVASLCLRAVDRFAASFGADRDVFVVRSTGRVNLMGMHVDHRGGHVNPFAVMEQFFVVGRRDDDVVRVANAAHALYPDDSFSISAELPDGRRIEDWDTWTHDRHKERVRHGSAGRWSNYARAAVLHLQHLHTAADGCFDPPLAGMDVAVIGSIPPASGLSSSSGLVVGMSEACLHANGLELSPTDFVDHCAEGEWYVGTRGGGGDHAAIKFGEKDHVLHLGSCPVTIDSSPMPAGHVIVLANSLVEAKKQTGARDIFNQRVAAYNLGFMLLRKNFPQYADRLEHLRDVNPERLQAPAQEIYRMIRSLPGRATRDEIDALLPDRSGEVERIVRSHQEPENGYLLRQVCMYGVAECIRSGMVRDILRAEDIERFGEVINISHDGDRVTRLENDVRVAVDNSLGDERIDALIADLDSGDPARAEGAALWRQPGGYDVSTPQQDEIVDIARACPGVVGAGLIGAGLGGAIAIVVRQKQAGALMDVLAEGYYRPRGLETACQVVRPVGGCGVLLPE